MAEFINKYNNNAAYSASAEVAARANLGKSTISLEDDTRVVHYDGVNVEIPEGVCPDVGDAMWVDSNNDKHFFKGDTVKHAALTARGMTFVGVVGMRKGNKAWVLHKDEVQTKFVNAWAFKVTGYSANTSIVFQQFNKENDSVAATVTGFTPMSSDVASVSAFATALNNFLRSHQPTASTTGTTGPAPTNWSAAAMDDGTGTTAVFIFIEGHPTDGIYYSQRLTPIASGATATLFIWDLVGYSNDYTSIQRNDNVNTWCCIWNKERIKQYNANINSPSDSLTSAGIYSKSNFTQSNCPTLYAYYGGDYDKYLDSKTVKIPCKKMATPNGTTAYYYGKAKDVCEKADAITFSSVVSSSAKPLFKAIGLSVSKSNSGNGVSWYMPGIEEFVGIFGGMLVNGQDKINKSFTQSNSSARSLSVYRWVPARYNYYYAWLLAYYGYTYNSFSGTYRACAVALLEF